MRARAEAVSSTRTRILRAMLDLAVERLTVEITLDDVAARAGVSVRTVLRHFGDRDGLLDAATELAIVEFEAERETTPGDVDDAMRVIVDHYETRGDFVIRLLAQEDDPRIGPMVAFGRLSHRTWVADAFGPRLPSGDAAREESIDLLVVATDVYAWKLLRRDRGLGRDVVEDRMRRMVALILAGLTDDGAAG